MQESDHLKASALDLLSSGNNVAAVASILGIPVDRVITWARDAPEAAAPQAVHQVGSVSGSANHLNFGMRVQPTGFIPLPLISRAVFVAFPFVAAAIMLAFGPLSILKQLNLLWAYRLALCLALAMGVSSIAYGLRAGFELTTQSILFRNAIATRELPYVDVSSYSVVHNAHLDAYLLKFATKTRANVMTIWLERGLVVEGSVALWLSTLPCTGVGSVYRGLDSDRVQLDWNNLLSACRSAGGEQ